MEDIIPKAHFSVLMGAITLEESYWVKMDAITRQVTFLGRMDIINQQVHFRAMMVDTILTRIIHRTGHSGLASVA